MGEQKQRVQLCVCVLCAGHKPGMEAAVCKYAVLCACCVFVSMCVLCACVCVCFIKVASLEWKQKQVRWRGGRFDLGNGDAARSWRGRK